MIENRRMRSALWILVLAACGDDGAAHPDAPMGVACQVDADCGAQFCNAKVCGPRPLWNAPTKLGGGVFLDGTNQNGVAVRGDNLEIVFVTNRGGQCADLWHATRATATADFDAATALANVNDAANCDKWPVLRADGLELFWDRASMTSVTGSSVYRATRTSTTADFGTPQKIDVATDMFHAGHTLSGDGLTMLYEQSAMPGTAISVYETKRASTSDVFAAGTVRTDLTSLAAAGLSLSPDGRYLVTVEAQTFQLQVRIASGDTFGAPTSIAEINAAAFDAQPSITPDGRTLYFSRRNTSNVYDIWSATRR